MGSALRVPVVVDKGNDPIAALRARGLRIVATSPHGGRSLFDADLTGPVAVLIGGEGAGLAAALIETADERVRIPMQAPVESLNAAVTAALIVYEAARQRSATKARHDGLPVS
jgi:tRNA G18 (ribose-2'-O)-methylase SpoU